MVEILIREENGFLWRVAPASTLFHVRWRVAHPTTFLFRVPHSDAEADRQGG